MTSERERMQSGALYDPQDPELVALRIRARDLCRGLNASGEADGLGTERRRVLLDLLGSGGDSAWIQPPFFCDYGANIHLGERVFFTSTASCSTSAR